MDHVLTHQDIPWPDTPQEIPPAFGLSRRRDFRLKQIFTLFLISQGFNVSVEIYILLGRFLGVNYISESYRRAQLSMVDAGLLTKAVPPVRGLRSKLSIVHLTLRGRKLCYTFGWTPLESEWERMKRIHEKGKSEPAHTCSTLAFAYQARLRGYKAGVMPEIESGRFIPDAIVINGEQKTLVEVELGYGKHGKWHNMATHQGHVAIAARTFRHRKSLIQECKDMSISGLATDMRTLFLTSKDDPPCPLWLDEWK
jgi:hypothetical protein